MFEGLVRQLLLGYLGQYIKDIHKEQLKITLWNEEVLLENVELILEAFDYLQLPFALKQGRVGRLSIKIPWKKLGWDPIIIILENVLISACQRDDAEWSMDAVERREFAGKKAKLAAAELGKLSRRVCDNQAGKSFISYLTAKILDGIQVSIRNFHVMYRNMPTDSVHTLFGLKFSSLTAMKQNLTSLKVRGGQVNKLVEVQGLEIYCVTFDGVSDIMDTEKAENSESRGSARVQRNKHDNLLAPVDVSMSLVVNRSGRLENNAPQYSVNVELTNLVLSLDEVQLQQILILCDNLCTCRLRDMYGRYRPWWSPLSKRLKGWQIAWWHYAQQSVLSDVCKRLKKTSWKYFGERIHKRRKYVKLYKIKLECLREEQLLEEDILWELEQIEKESDIDDILSYRSAAERELQEFLASSSYFGAVGSNIAVDKLLNDERTSTKPRGWLNWLSRGMLGAGGTDDSSQFSGVVSDEVIKDIYEATKFHPMPLVDAASDEVLSSSVKLSIRQISTTLHNMRFGFPIAMLIIEGTSAECMVWEEFAVITVTVSSVEMTNPLNKQVIVNRATFEENFLQGKNPSLNIKIDVPRLSYDDAISIQAMIQPLEVTFDSAFLLNITELLTALESFEFLQERILLSLNGIDDVKVRVESKAEYILSSRKRLKWDVCFVGAKVVIPWKNAKSELHKVVLESGAFFFLSKCEVDFVASERRAPAHDLRNFDDPITELLLGAKLHDLFDHFEIKLNDIEVKMFIPLYSDAVSLLEKVNVSINLSSCIVCDESLLKRLEVNIGVSSLVLHFSPSIYGAMLDFCTHFRMLHLTSNAEVKTTASLLDMKSNAPRHSIFWGVSGFLRLGSANFLVDLENDSENSCTLMVSLQEFDIRCSITDFPECWICTKAVKIVTRSRKSKEDIRVLSSSERNFPAYSAHPHEVDADDVSDPCEMSGELGASSDGCFLLHYEVQKKMNLISHKYTIWLSDFDFDCYPHVMGLLVGFSDKINRYHTSAAVKDMTVVEGNKPLSSFGFEFKRFGYSNFFEVGSSEWSCIPLGQYPFVTIKNAGSLLHIDSSLIYPDLEWRNVFKLRESKLNNPGICVKKGSRKLNASLKSTCGNYVTSAPKGLYDTVLVSVNLILGSIRVHFHDSSCILGTLTLPSSKSSFSIYEDSLDILCSIEGLTLSSSWGSQSFQDFLWGPSLPNLSPVLNIRVRKGNFGSLSSLFEISFSIQHVSCVLPPEFLAIIIGYFSLPDWSSTTEQPVTDADRYMDSDENIDVTFKFEILDSILISPVESVDCQFLKLDTQQLYCSFIHNGFPDIFVMEIPAECLVPAHKIADRNHCLNLFGRNLFLSLVLLKDDTSDSKFIPSVEQRAISLIAPITVDIWIRIPCEFESPNASSFTSTCVMSRITNCQFAAEGANMLVGLEALQDVIDQFSFVDRQSQIYKSDVLQFLQLKRSLKETSPPPPESSIVTFTEIKCSVHSMSVKLYSSETDSIGYKLVAEAGMQFICSASLKDDKLLFLELSFSSLALFSSFRSLTLAECMSPSLASSVLATSFSTSDEGENDIHISLPSLDIWLHLSNWNEILDLFSIYSDRISKSTPSITSLKKSTWDPDDQSHEKPEDVSKHSPESPTLSSCFASGNVNVHDLSFVVKSEDVGIRIHIPLQVRNEAFRYFGEPQVHGRSPPYEIHNPGEEGQCSFVIVTFRSRCSELLFDGQVFSLKTNLEKTSGIVELRENKSVHSWPFFQMFQVHVEARISGKQMEHLQVIGEIQCERFDVWLSHHIFYFWRSMLFELPGSGSSQFPLCFVDFRIQLETLSLALTDQKWSSNGPLLEILVRNLVMDAKAAENKLECAVDGELQVNYNNIHKVFWEPFLEPWEFQLTLSREQGKSSLLTSSMMTDIHLASTSELNLNVTESFIEVVFRAIDMIKDAWDLTESNVLYENPGSSKIEKSENAYTGRYAPYILQNLTSLPLVFHVCEGPIFADGMDVSELSDGHFVQPGSSYPVYIDETPKEQFFDFSCHSYDRIIDKKFTRAAHRYIIIQLEGMSIHSTPISMDLVGVSYVEVDFSKSSNGEEVVNAGDVADTGKELEGNNRYNVNNGYVIPVVIDVSVQRHTKLVRLYSTVILLNATSVPFEVRFDIPFGVSPKILDPIYPGQEFPLPLHLAEAGRIRWRPLGSTYLWSEAYSVSSILSHESRIGFLRSFVCYPSLPSSDTFRCCITVHDMCVPSVGRKDKGSSLCINDNLKQSLEKCNEVLHHPEGVKKRFIHLVTLSSPLTVKNYLPEAVSVTVESGGVTRSVLLSEVETSFFHIDSSHDLAIAFQMQGFQAAILKFPRVETFGANAKFSGTKFSLSETITLDSDLSRGPLYVTMEKVLDAFSGAREVCISVPFLLYNCCGFPLTVSNTLNEMNAHACTVPSCYDLDEDLFDGKKDGLGLISADSDFHMFPLNGSLRNSSINNHIVSTRKSMDTHESKVLRKSSNLSGSSNCIHESPDTKYIDVRKSSGYSGDNSSCSSSQADMKSTGFNEYDNKKANFCMYSPDPNSPPSEIMVRVSRCMPGSVRVNIPSWSWSSPFFIVPPTGSATVLVPQKSANAAYIISVTSSAVAGPFSGQTRIITLQPRYVISNACSKDLCYRQKGSESVFQLKVGQNSHIQWTDLTRELLVSVRFNEPGWQWSGSFVPEHLGDTQLKMRNYVSGAVNIIRVEVQNADVSIRDEKIVGNPHGNSGTYLILLSDDDTGFMPYRIDNFSKERLRVFQQRCETFETAIHSYTSVPYAWDEPCYPHRLIVEVPAERIIGSYALDEAKDHKTVYLPATSEKPERTLLVSVHSEGAMKVLSIIDSSYHILDDMEGPHFPRFDEKREHQQKQRSSVVYKERISVDIPFIGLSVMNSSPQELLFACAKNTLLDLVQSLDQQKFCLQISSLQIDNQLQSTPYPVILSFDHDCVSNPMRQTRTKDNRKIKNKLIMQVPLNNSHEPVFSLTAVKWRNKDTALVSFEYISLRVADCHLELEQEVILSLFDLFKTASSRFQSGILSNDDALLHRSLSDFSSVKASCVNPEDHEIVGAQGSQTHSAHTPMFVGNGKNNLFPPSIVPIGAPWQKIYLLARRQKKVYVERIDMAPIKLTLSFSSSPWMLRNGVLTSGEYLIHRGLMALADVEGAQIHLKQLAIAHQLASWESIEEILIRHYTRQLLHEMYKVFGSAGVIGNPMGFARNVGLGIKDFLSVPARSFMQSPAGLVAGMAQGTTSLLSNTVYAISDAATQFSRAAHKGIIAFTFDDPAAVEIEKQLKGMSPHSKGVINEFLEGLTGLLQSPIRGAEKHGLPGVLSGIALGVTGLVARPAASILEVTGKTAQSIRNRSKLYSMRFRVRLPRPLSKDSPLRPYLWEEAVGALVLANAGYNLKLKDEVPVMSKALREGGKFVIITRRLILIVSCSSLVNLGKPDFQGVPPDPEWVIEAQMGMDSIIHADIDQNVIHIVGSSSDTLFQQQKRRGKQWYTSPPHPTPLPLFQTDLEFLLKEEAVDFLRVLLSTIEKGKEQGWGNVYRLHQINVK